MLLLTMIAHNKCTQPFVRIASQNFVIASAGSYWSWFEMRAVPAIVIASLMIACAQCRSPHRLPSAISAAGLIETTSD